MRKFLLAALAIAMTPALVPAAASAHVGPAPHAQALHREVVQERRELRQDRRELHRDRHELRQDRRQLHRARVARAQHRHWVKHHRRHYR